MSGSSGDEHVWERGWEGHAEAQRRRFAALTLRQKIEWLEEAQRIVDHLARQRVRRATDKHGED